MNSPEQSTQPDLRLENPDQYFSEKYGDIEIQYKNGRTMKLGVGLQAERLIRGDEVMDNLTPEQKLERTIKFTKMLREAGALDSVDDIEYPEGS